MAFVKIVLIVCITLISIMALAYIVRQLLIALSAARIHQELHKHESNTKLYRSAAFFSILAVVVAGSTAFSIHQLLKLDTASQHRKIAYVSDQNGSNDIWLMDERGQATALTFEMSNERQPRWSPNGQWIAFLSNQSGNDDIHMISTEASGKWQVTDSLEDESWMSWSPSGSEILYVRRGQQISEICLSEIDTVHKQTPRNHCIFQTDGRINKPSFSPDGTQIVFNLGHGGYFQLWLVERDRSNPRNIDPTIQSGIAAWSPTGDSIVYRVAADYNKPSDLKIFSLDDSIIRHLKHIEASQVQANWSPDGKMLYFTSDRSDPPLDEMKWLGLVEVESTELHWLDQGICWVYWQAQSWQVETWDEQNRILYSKEVDGQQDLFLLDTDDMKSVRLTETPFNEFNAVFSPNSPLTQR